MEVLEKIYNVFGLDTPNRITYNAVVASPTSTAYILKKYKNWKAFEKAYIIFCGTKRTVAPVATKPATPVITKTAVKK